MSKRWSPAHLIDGSRHTVDPEHTICANIGNILLAARDALQSGLRSIDSTIDIIMARHETLEAAMVQFWGAAAVGNAAKKNGHDAIGNYSPNFGGAARDGGGGSLRTEGFSRACGPRAARAQHFEGGGALEGWRRRWRKSSKFRASWNAELFIICESCIFYCPSGTVLRDLLVVVSGRSAVLRRCESLGE